MHDLRETYFVPIKCLSCHLEKHWRWPLAQLQSTGRKVHSSLPVLFIKTDTGGRKRCWKLFSAWGRLNCCWTQWTKLKLNAIREMRQKWLLTTKTKNMLLSPVCIYLFMLQVLGCHCYKKKIGKKLIQMHNQPKLGVWPQGKGEKLKMNAETQSSTN